MSTVRTICPACQKDVPVPSDRVTLLVDPARGNRYEFDCPACGRHCSKAADERSTRLLRAGGVPERWATMPTQREIGDWIVALSGTTDVVGLMEYEVSRG